MNKKEFFSNKEREHIDQNEVSQNNAMENAILFILAIIYMNSL